MSQVWNMELTESMNICYVSVRVSHTIKVKIKETFMEKTYYLRNLAFSEGRTYSGYYGKHMNLS